MRHYVGLDISMKETFICIEDETGKIIAQGKTKTEPELIAKYIKKFEVEIAKVGLESGSLCHWLLSELKALSIPAICIDARKMATLLSVQINKTDKNDARGIASAMRSGLYKEVTERSAKELEIGTLLGCRRLLVTQKVQISNSIRGFLKTYGIRLQSSGEKSFAENARKALKNNQIIAQEGIDRLLRCYEQILRELKELTQKVETLAKEDQAVKRLMTIPGIGAITALSYAVEIGNPKRFKKSKQVGAYLGMTPKQYSSGETQRQGRVSKCGSVEVRTLLNEGGLVLLTRSKKWSKLKAWGIKIYRKHGMKKASMAVGRKLAIIMHKMLLNEADFIYGEEKQAA
ncbi:MAG: IS110 family transposase [Chlamydiales bacterium]|nr:IS110 family transposase [Chlamydiales bacterium]MCP5506664.1 IS110 family transposase [Chlamydiales bacterium]